MKICSYGYMKNTIYKKHMDICFLKELQAIKKEGLFYTTRCVFGLPILTNYTQKLLLPQSG